MKKCLSVLLAAVLLFSMTACGKKEPEEEPFVEDIYAPPVFEADAHSYNPLTGLIDDTGYSSTHLPVASTINNIKDALPQYGITKADIIYEVVAEGGITRMVAVFSNPNDVPAIGSVRSVRPYFARLARGLDATLFHYGGSDEALNLIPRIGLRSVNGITSNTGFYLDNNRRRTYSKEHCMFTGAEFIKQALDARGWTQDGTPVKAYNFVGVDELPVNITYGSANTIQWDFSKYDPNCVLSYNEDTCRYEKYEYGHAQVDAGAGNEVLSFDNCFILFDRITTSSDGVHMVVDLKGGSGFYFTRGRYVPISWAKDSDASPLTFFNEDGSELKINVGNSYVAIVGNEHRSSLSIE